MRILLGFVMLLSLAGRPLLATVADTLTTSEIEDAIRLGRFGQDNLGSTSTAVRLQNRDRR